MFAIYVLFLLATLLVFGSLSDHIGRRPVILAAIVVDVAACVLFLLAHGPGLLFAARALEGIAVGAISSTLGAVLLDLRPRGGLAPGSVDRPAGENDMTPANEPGWAGEIKRNS